MIIRDQAIRYLASERREAFLSVLASELTVSARAGYVEAGETIENVSHWLRCHNEIMHQLTNHLRMLLTLGESTYDDLEFFDVLVRTASERGGCESSLAWAVQQTITALDRE
jgi:hypothetical protein